MSDMLRVLLVDDDRILVRLITLRLTAHGFSVRCALNGQDGLVAAREWIPHVILLDYLMPGMDGLAFLEKLRGTAELASVPVVMLSANAGVLQRKRALDLGAKYVLSKPFEPGLVCDALRAAARAGVNSGTGIESGSVNSSIAEGVR